MSAASSPLADVKVVLGSCSCLFVLRPVALAVRSITYRVTDLRAQVPFELFDRSYGWLMRSL